MGIEVCFDLIVPAYTLNGKFELSEVYIEWGGINYSQEPKRYISNNGIKFTSRIMPNHIREYISNHVDLNDYVFLSMDSEHLNVWEVFVNDKSKNVTDVPMRKFLLDFLKGVNAWGVVFELNCDQIDFVFESNGDELVSYIDDILIFNNDNKGFIAYGKNN